MTPPLFKVSYEDEDYLFGDADRRWFGRDDEACAIPIWEEIRRTAVSKVAGELWCMDNEMWLRNVSTAHELEVAGLDGPPQYLPVRRPDERGAARSIPVPTARISAPSTGSWYLTVERLGSVLQVGCPVGHRSSRPARPDWDRFRRTYEWSPRHCVNRY